MEEKLELLQKILHSSKEFTFNGTVLTIRHYYTGDSINLDLSMIDEDMLSELIVDDDDLDEDEDW